MVEGEKAGRSTSRLRLRRASDVPEQTSAPSEVAQPVKSSESRTALIGVVSTLVVAALGAATTLGVTVMSSQNGRDQSAEDFRRTQQQTTYADFISAANAVALAENEYKDVEAAGLFVSDSLPINEKRDAAQKAAALLDAKESMVQLVASSSDVGATASIVTDFGKRLHLAIRDAAIAEGISKKPSKDDIGRIALAQIRLSQSIREFALAGHDDLFPKGS